MGFFSDYFLGTATSGTTHALSTEEMHHLLSKISKPEITPHLKEIVAKAVLEKRQDGKITLKKIDGILHQLQHEHVLTELDRKDFFEAFTNHFEHSAHH